MIITGAILTVAIFFSFTFQSKANATTQDIRSTHLASINQARENVIVPQKESEQASKNLNTFSNTGSLKEKGITAQSFLVKNLETDEVLFSSQATTTLSIASVTKLVTALTAESLIPKSSNLTVTERALATEGIRGYLQKDEKLDNEDLTYALLLESSNDAAEVLAQHYPRFYFMQQMNSFAKEIGMTSTYFDDPSGLSANNVSTSFDLMHLLEYIIENDAHIIDISAVDSYSSRGHSWKNINSHRFDKGFLGGKTGYTNAAKRTAVLLYEIENTPIGIVILGSNDRNADVDILIQETRNLLQ